MSFIKLNADDYQNIINKFANGIEENIPILIDLLHKSPDTYMILSKYNIKGNILWLLYYDISKYYRTKIILVTMLTMMKNMMMMRRTTMMKSTSVKKSTLRVWRCCETSESLISSALTHS